MRASTRSLRFVLSAALCLAISWPAQAAVDAYIKIEGAKQGQFKGATTRQGSHQWIPVVAVAYEARSPRDAQSGLATGKRQHQPVKITKEMGAASAQLHKALTGNEQLKQVVIEIVRPGPQGREQVYQTITLTNAVVTAIQPLHEQGKKNGQEREEISFTYEKLQVTYTEGGKTTTDSWTGK